MNRVDIRISGLAHLCIATTKAAPSRRDFRRVGHDAVLRLWPHPRFRLSPRSCFSSGTATATIVRGAHPSKSAKDEAAELCDIATSKYQGWASPHLNEGQIV